MGVWIEILARSFKPEIRSVTPCVGVWIEIVLASRRTAGYSVTPCVGVWIEIMQNLDPKTTF